MITSDAEPDDPEMFDYKSLYEDILKNEKKSEKSAQTEEKSENKADEEKKSDEEHFNSIIREIRRLNDEIEDKDVSDKIDVIEAHTKNIFDYVTENPEAMPQIRTFMNYYLPNAEAAPVLQQDRESRRRGREYAEIERKYRKNS